MSHSCLLTAACCVSGVNQQQSHWPGFLLQLTEDAERQRRDAEALVQAAEEEEAAGARKTRAPITRTPSVVARRGSLEVRSEVQQQQQRAQQESLFLGVHSPQSTQCHEYNPPARLF